MRKKPDSINIKSLGNLQQDNIFPRTYIKSLSELTGMPSRKGLENVLISNDKIVNVVSKNYGHLDNKDVFGSIEAELIQNDINFVCRSINRDDRAFSVDYILADSANLLTVKNSEDKLLPMLRFTNSYDGSCPTTGKFAIYRQVCQNGLHVVQHTELEFSTQHRSNIYVVTMPKIAGLIEKFKSNEFYELKEQMERMASKPISDVQKWVQGISEALKENGARVFTFGASTKNPDEPGKNARFVIDTIAKEAKQLKTRPNMWLGYNAINELIHTQITQPFGKQAAWDVKTFEVINA